MINSKILNLLPGDNNKENISTSNILSSVGNTTQVIPRKRGRPRKNIVTKRKCCFANNTILKNVHVILLMYITFIAANDNCLTSVTATQSSVLQSITSDGTSSHAIEKVTRPRGRPPTRSLTPVVDNFSNDVDIQCNDASPLNDSVNMIPNVASNQLNFQTPPSANRNINSCKFIIFLLLFIIYLFLKLSILHVSLYECT